MALLLIGPPQMRHCSPPDNPIAKLAAQRQHAAQLTNSAIGSPVVEQLHRTAAEVVELLPEVNAQRAMDGADHVLSAERAAFGSLAAAVGLADDLARSHGAGEQRKTRIFEP